jgi:hypothetical protein
VSPSSFWINSASSEMDALTLTSMV